MRDLRSTIVVISENETATAVPALRVLWPKHDEAAMVAIIDNTLRPNGYQLVGVVPDEGRPAACVMGYRLQQSLWLGKSFYIVDIATLPDYRGQGLASRMLDWAEAKAHELGCNALHLDSGVGPDRSDAHRLYMQKRYQIACHHFVRKLG